jgi:hypothetical protein
MKWLNIFIFLILFVVSKNGTKFRKKKHTCSHTCSSITTCNTTSSDSGCSTAQAARVDGEHGKHGGGR